jgi:hypothetical protein
LLKKQAVALKKCQLAGHKRAGPKTEYVSQYLQFAKKLPLGSANMVAKKKKEKKKKRDRGKGKDDRMLIRSNLTFFT